VVAFLLNLGVAGIVFAADGEIIPLPANTQQVKQETRSIAGTAFDCSYYESDLDPGQVRNFYRKILSGAGWKENNYLDDLKKNVPDFQPDAVTLKAVENNLVFEKKGVMLNIVFTPATAPVSKKTDYSIMQGKLDLSGKNAGELDFTPRLVDTPQKEPAPVYPGAALVSMTEGAKFLKTTYTVNDGIEAVIDFYRSGMAGYGWTLAEDEPVSRIGAATKEDVAKYSPEFVKKGFVFEPEDMLFKELTFTNSGQDKCAIDILQISVPANAQTKEMMFTNIMVDYEKK